MQQYQPYVINNGRRRLAADFKVHGARDSPLTMPPHPTSHQSRKSNALYLVSDPLPSNRRHVILPKLLGVVKTETCKFGGQTRLRVVPHVRGARIVSSGSDQLAGVDDRSTCGCVYKREKLLKTVDRKSRKNTARPKGIDLVT